MMMPHLSEDLVEEILSRVPAISLKRLRYTCKQWNALFNDQRFSKKHRDKAPKTYLGLTLKDFRIYSMSSNLHGLLHNNNIDLLMEFKGKLSSLNDLNDFEISQIYPCDGLILCSTKRNTRLVVWNPCTGQTRWIKRRNRRMCDTFAFGYDNSKSSCLNNYKILRVCEKIKGQQFEYEIFEFSSNSWRVLDVNPNCIIEGRSVSVKGNSYWFATITKTHYFIRRFDFSSETFQKLPLPFHIFDYNDSRALSAFREEQLSVLHQSFDTEKMDIWVTNKIDETTDWSWSKFFTVRLINRLDYPISMMMKSPLSFFIDEKKNIILCYDKHRENTYKSLVLIVGKDKVYREFYFPESYELGRTYLCNYVPSLVQIKQSGLISTRKRKRKDFSS
ncbi:unnamed protein product [Arabidopsis thaliana]|uniref:Putative F-box protein At3g17490 n=1 Tax=Arabidopsis thaliana TaxID=3702 RepID=FB153_ARATH|nr:F-box and associated interaction domains-containing protein [Arabidopsis thaliana]Q9LUP8.1 RecName: Full=Putative F-box protein At3g17490 [Arabidopsis thaliana]AEE75960.1 F-box and associated interaction domains-containing protein [Arabidopsis thaliana]BAB02038.1 unnamed protein product [Arabidopsis thaliana]|eukprot:NP_188376.1 F-box and associated interaction domains-containing protein [Arabidopsis thaliana]